MNENGRGVRKGERGGGQRGRYKRGLDEGEVIKMAST